MRRLYVVAVLAQRYEHGPRLTAATLEHPRWPPFTFSCSSGLASKIVRARHATRAEVRGER